MIELSGLFEIMTAGVAYSTCPHASTTPRVLLPPWDEKNAIRLNSSFGMQNEAAAGTIGESENSAAFFDPPRTAGTFAASEDRCPGLLIIKPPQHIRAEAKREDGRQQQLSDSENNTLPPNQ